MNSTENLADILTKPLGHQAHFKLMKPVLFRGVPNQGECQKVGSGDGPSDVYLLVTYNKTVMSTESAMFVKQVKVTSVKLVDNGKTCGQE